MHVADSNQKRRVISVFVLAMFNVSIMASLRNLPLVAEYGLSIVFFFFAVALLFLIPCAFVSAELATGWARNGGIYIWVREALGDRWGFFSIWMQWIHNVAWYPVILSFVASTLAYVINPDLAHNKRYVLSVILGSFWGMTLLNYLGIKTSSLFSTLGVILGTIGPGILVIGLGLSWLLGDNPAQIQFTPEALLPDLSKLGNLVFLSGLFLAFAGLEVTAAFAGEVESPQKNYPRAIVLSALITFGLFMLGSLAIAIVIPKNEISLVAGLMDAFKVFFHAYRLDWFLAPMGILLIIGAIAEVNSWIVGPVKGLYYTSIHGNLPPIFQKVNKRGTPTNLLFFQAVIVTASSLVILNMPTLSSSYWILSALSAQSYLVMYIMMFIAAIRLRYTHPHVPRVFKVPYKTHGIWFFSTVGILASLFAIFLGFVPPTQLQVGNLFFYEGFLIVGLGVMIALPLLIYQLRKPHWQRINEE